MKAKEYVEWLHQKEKEVEEKEAFLDLAFRFMKEVGTIAKMRHTNRDSALLAILREQNQKWNAMRKFDKRIKRDGFIECIKADMPFVKDMFDKEKMRRGLK